MPAGEGLREGAREVAGRYPRRGLVRQEPPLDIYMEGLTRTNATGGIAILTFTPLLGMSEVVMLFLTEDQLRALTKQGSDEGR